MVQNHTCFKLKPPWFAYGELPSYISTFTNNCLLMEEKDFGVQIRYNIGTKREELMIQINRFGAVLMSFPDEDIAVHVYNDLMSKKKAFFNKNVFGKGFYTEKGVNFYSLGYN